MRAFTGIEIVLLVIRLTVHYVVTCRASVERSSVAIILVRGRPFPSLHPVPTARVILIPDLTSRRDNYRMFRVK